ncbi:MAG: pyruvate ferredoxin oxidoreductase [Candidatus Lokiarchaeota archaeon]|nr:pyruvate ferredoxin oxidoreductase [Candidatus Lokiarchaeota archaeon]
MEDDKYPNAHKKILASVQTPVVGEAGFTSTWRTMRPVINLDKCVVVVKDKHNCHMCWLFCPEGTISRTIPPKVNYDYCKGCGICAHECPHNAIEMIEEGDNKSCPV